MMTTMAGMKHNFTDQQEFYSDFNDYTLNVTVPQNFVVWATGTLQNPGKYCNRICQTFPASMKSDSTIHIATLKDMQSNKVTAKQGINIWQWTATDIPDVTVAISDHYVWDGASVVVDDATHRRTSMQSAFNDTAADFHAMTHFGTHALGWLSHNWPGQPYPYPKMTAVQGYADMEYPMMINDSHTDQLFFAGL